MRSLRDRWVRWQAAAVAVSLTLSGASWADSPRPSPPPDEFTTLQERGDDAVDAGNLSEAVANWTKAFELRPDDPYLACNIGGAELRRLRHREAARWLTRCVHQAPPASSPEDLERSKQWTLELFTARQTVSTLTINVDEPDTKVVVDDEPPQVTPLLEDIFVLPGEHRIEARHGDLVTATVLSTKAGKEYRVALAFPIKPLARAVMALPPADTPSSPNPIAVPSPSFRWWPVVAGSALVATGIAVGTSLTLTANIASANEKQVLDAMTIDWPNGDSCARRPVENDPRCADWIRYGTRRADLSNGALATFITSGVFMLGTIGYVIYENHRITVAPTLGGAVGTYVW